MIKEDININKYEYHRNGVYGKSFTTIFFTFTEDNIKYELIGILTGDNNECYVIDPLNPESHWRGDNFEPYLKEFIGC